MPLAKTNLCECLEISRISDNPYYRPFPVPTHWTPRPTGITASGYLLVRYLIFFTFQNIQNRWFVLIAPRERGEEGEEEEEEEEEEEGRHPIMHLTYSHQRREGDRLRPSLINTIFSVLFDPIFTRRNKQRNIQKIARGTSDGGA